MRAECARRLFGDFTFLFRPEDSRWRAGDAWGYADGPGAVLKINPNPSK